MKLSKSVGLGLAVIFLLSMVSTQPQARAEDGFQDCSSMMHGYTCKQIDKHSMVFQACCTMPSPDDGALSRVELRVHNLKQDLVSCLNQRVRLESNPTACERRGCFCGIDDSALPSSCFDREQTCCTRHPEPLSPTPAQLRAQARDLRIGYSGCQDDLAKLRDQNRPSVPGRSLSSEHPSSGAASVGPSADQAR